MSMRTFYVRKENEKFFDGLENKSKTLNALLSKLNQARGDEPVGSSPTPRTNTIIQPTEFIPKPPDPEIGYPCCKNITPCKHWTFDGNQSLWINLLTGKTREVQG